MRIMDIILSFPSLLLALVLVAVLGPSLWNAMLAIAIVLQPHYVRLTRAAVLTERSKDYVTSAHVAGAGRVRMMFITVLPNCLAPIIVQAALSFSNAILDVAALWVSGDGGRNRRRRNGAPNAGRKPRVHPACVVGRDLPRFGDPDHGSGHQPDGRRPARTRLIPN